MRNKSEQLPSCPQAHAYAAMVDLFLKDGTHHLQLPRLWFAIPDDVQRRLHSGVPDYWKTEESIADGDRRWRGEIATRIRAWYGP